MLGLVSGIRGLRWCGLELHLQQIKNRDFGDFDKLLVFQFTTW